MLCTVLYHIRIVTNKEVQRRFLFVLSTSVFFDNVSSENPMFVYLFLQFRKHFICLLLSGKKRGFKTFRAETV